MKNSRPVKKPRGIKQPYKSGFDIFDEQINQAIEKQEKEKQKDEYEYNNNAYQ